jgi:hypothetical protein
VLTSLRAVTFMMPQATAPKAANGVLTLHRLVPFGETNEASDPTDVVEGMERHDGCPSKIQRSSVASG